MILPMGGNQEIASLVPRLSPCANEKFATVKSTDFQEDYTLNLQVCNSYSGKTENMLLLLFTKLKIIFQCDRKIMEVLVSCCDN